MQLTSLSNVKAFLEKKDSTHDSLINLLLTGVSARIETFLNREMYKEQRTQYFDAGRKMYFLPAYPIDLTATLTVLDGTITQDINDDFYVWEDQGKIEIYSPSLRVQPKQICITWTGGYASSATVPNEIQYATILQTALIFKRRAQIGSNNLSLPDGSISTMVTESLLPEVKSILKGFRRTPGMI